MSSSEAGSSPSYRFALLADPFPIFVRAKLCLHAFRFYDPVEIVEPGAKVEFHIVKGLSADASDLYKFTDAALLRWRFSQGELCWAAKAEEEIVSYVWAAPKRERVGELCKSIELKEGEIYLYDAFTVPEWRGKGLYPAILSRQLDYFKHKGYERALIFTVEENLASRRGILRAGFYHFQTIALTKILNLAFYKCGAKTPPHEPDVTFLPWEKPSELG